MYTRFLKKPLNSTILLGPRGTGKSTWIKQHFNEAVSYDLLNNQEFLRLSRNPSLIYDELKNLPSHSWVVIDEIQKVPTLLDEVHRLIENHHIKFLLSGSSARKLKKTGVNLLAGRALLQNFFTLTSMEVNFQFKKKDHYVYGMLPLAFSSLEPENYLETYAQLYLKEEIQAEALTRNFGGFSRFLEIAARQNSQTTNVANISRDAQVARSTVQGYFDILIDTLIGFWLPAWELKSATKQVLHPKFYFFDSGVARALSGRLMYPPLPEEKGHLFETFIINEVRAYLSLTGLKYPIYFWSSYNGIEVDLLFETKSGWIAIEIKSADYWHSSFNKGLMRIREDFLPHSIKSYGVFCGPRKLENHGITVLPYVDFLKALWNHELLK